MKQLQTKTKALLFLTILLFIAQAGFFILWRLSIRQPNQHAKQVASGHLPTAENHLPANYSYFMQKEFSEESTPEKQSVLKLLFFGDMMLDRHVGEKIQAQGFDYIFAKLVGQEGRFFQNIDLISANLEGAVTDEGAHYSPVKTYDFAFAPELLNQFKKYNFNFFNLANNHFADQGERGIGETRANLAQLGFYHSGCPNGQVGECSAVIVEISGQKIGLAGFSMAGSTQIDMDAVDEIVRDLRQKSDLVIINMHWGQEYKHQFNQKQQQAAYLLIKAGADIIIGHHPHVVQGIEIYQGRPIFYSLGNFIFDQYFSPDTQQGLGLGISVSLQKTEVFLYPLQSHLAQIELMNTDKREAFLQKLSSLSKLDLDYLKQIKTGRLVLKPPTHIMGGLTETKHP